MYAQHVKNRSYLITGIWESTIIMGSNRMNLNSLLHRLRLPTRGKIESQVGMQAVGKEFTHIAALHFAVFIFIRAE